AMITAVGAQLVERVSYTPYGVGSHRYGHDANNDGAVTTSTSTPGTDGYLVDQLASTGGGTGTDMVDGSGDLVSTYDVAADIDRDGEIDSADLSLLTTWGAKSALSAGLISDAVGPDNVIGYDGYVFAHEHRSYSARYRWNDPVLGRWLQRDYLVYEDGMNLYEYTGSNPIGLTDPSGLNPKDKTYGLPKEFWNWYHEFRKSKGDPDLTKEQALQHYDDFKQAKLDAKAMGKESLRKDSKPWKNRRGGATCQGMTLSLVITGALLLNDAADLLQDRGSFVRLYLKELQSAVDSGKCNEAQLERLGEEASQEVLIQTGDKNWAAFEYYRQAVRDACRESKGCEDRCENSEKN
ncbi:MAG: hypothetical protein IT436_18560, partial [Phycisphaerales bacterium]|nr:hypothetical protein [Phycisphaerales bacterium]